MITSKNQGQKSSTVVIVLAFMNACLATVYAENPRIDHGWLNQSQVQATTFVKRSTNRRRDCAVMPAFQFHVGQNPMLELEVDQATDDWQFVVSVKGRSGAPLIASKWRTGPGKVAFNLAEVLEAKGYDLNYAEPACRSWPYWSMRPDDV